MVKVIDKFLLEDWKTLREEEINLEKKLSIIQKPILARIDYIVEFMTQSSDYLLEEIDYDGVEFLEDVLSKDEYFGVTVTEGLLPNIIDKKGKTVEINLGFIPKAWLFEDFEEEFTNGVKLYEAKKRANKQKAKQQKREREELKKQVIGKLTKEERKALGV